MPAEVRSVADLPFCRRTIDELFAVGDDDGDEVDLDHEAFGFARVDALDLEDETGRVTTLHEPLIIGLHGADEQPAGLVNDIELEFYLTAANAGFAESRRSMATGSSADGQEIVFAAKLSRFLEVHLPTTLGSERHVVLAVCNPNSAKLVRPAAFGSRYLHYAVGPVDSWLVEPDGLAPRLRLRATTWHTLAAHRDDS